MVVSHIEVENMSKYLKQNSRNKLETIREKKSNEEIGENGT
jgi:hypothetical protein